MLRKLFVSALVAGVLGFQAYVLVFEPKLGWYWPFMDYPMYSAAHFPGETFARRELRLVACDPGAEPRAVRFRDLHVMPWPYEDLLAGCGPDANDASVTALRRAVAENVPGRHCGLEVRSRTFTIGPQGLEDRNPPWTVQCTLHGESP